MADYIKIPAIQSKLKLSQDRIVYVSGMAGYGKTAAVEYFFRRKKHLTIKGCPGICKNLPELEELKDDVIVVDDLQWVTDEESREYIMRLCTQGGQTACVNRQRPSAGMASADRFGTEYPAVPGTGFAVWEKRDTGTFYSEWNRFILGRYRRNSEIVIRASGSIDIVSASYGRRRKTG